MYLNFPLSPRPAHQCDYHSSEFKRMVLHDFILESLLEEQSIIIAYQNQDDLYNFEELRDLEIKEEHISNFSFFDQIISIKNSLAKLIEVCGNYHKPLFGKQTFWELADMYFNNFTQNKKQLISPDITESNFDSDLYRDYKQTLDLASKLYKQEVKYFLNTSTINLTSFIDNGENEAAIKYVETFLKEATHIQVKLQTFFEEYKNNRYKEFNEIFNVLTARYDKWNEMQQNFGLEPKKESLHFIKSQLLELGSICRDKMHIPEEMRLKDFEEILLRLSHNFKKQIDQEFKVLNIRNTSDESISDINVEVEDLIKKINDSQLFKQDFSINSLSLKLCSEALDSLILNLENGLFELNPAGQFGQWMYFYNKLTEPKKKLVDGCLEIPSAQWQAAFDKWFLYTFLTKHGLHESESIYSSIESIDQQFEQLRFDFSTICKSLINEKELSLRFCSASDLHKYSGQNLVWLGDLAHPLLNEAANNFQYILGLKPKNDNESAFTLLHESMTQAEEDEDELEWKLKRSKVLATYFLESANAVNLYLTNEHNIIIESEFADLKDILKDKIKDAKHIGMRENAFKVFTEYFLNDSEISFYFYDQSALHFASASDVYRHISKIKALQQCGYFTIAIDRTRLYEEGYIQQILHPQSNNYA